MADWVETTAKELRVGDILEPDGAKVTKVKTDNNRVDVSIQGKTWTVTSTWPMRRRFRAEEILR